VESLSLLLANKKSIIYVRRASKQQTDKQPEKVEADESSVIPEVDKEIYEAYDECFPHMRKMR
jgi:hypothetical protein